MTGLIPPPPRPIGPFGSFAGCACAVAPARISAAAAHMIIPIVMKSPFLNILETRSPPHCDDAKAVKMGKEAQFRRPAVIVTRTL